MKIIIAEKAGYCFGIQNAMAMVENTLETYPGQQIYCLGDISHNRQEMGRLITLGVKKVDTLDAVEDGVVIIRSHGVGRNVITAAEEKALTIVNATCPFVRAMQNKVRDYYEKGYQIVIVGNAEHPEVVGAMGWCDDSGIVLSSGDEVDALPHFEKICVVAQTTIIETKFQRITEALKNKADECVIFNTICSATAERQAAAAKTAEGVEYMIVVGGYHSSNTQKLLEVCKAHCKNTCHIETAGELDPDEIKKYQTIGITAGASTPDWIVKEVTESMEENVLEQEQTQAVLNDVADEEFDFAKELEDSMKSIRKGAPVEGEVIAVDADEVILNIGYKSDAVIKKSDYTWKHDEELTDLVKPGDLITAIVTDLNDGSSRVKLSKIKYENQKVQNKLAEAFENQDVLEGKIKSVSGSGLIVDIGFTDIFMPASQYHVRYVKDLESLIGEEVKGKIIDYNAKRRRAILSQKVILEKEIKEKQAKQREVKEKRFGELNVDDVVKGNVKTITNFGIFVDLDGIDGFVHRSDLTWERANEPKDLVQKGQEIEAKVISKNEEDKKIKLSVKALMPRPWDVFVQEYNEKDDVEVKITNVLDFGAFAEIIPGVEGLIHVSEISYDRVESVAAVLKPGDVVKVKIIGINTEKEKISLSIKATLEAPERPQRSRSKKREGGFTGDRPNRGGGQKKRAAQNRNTTVYEESANVTLGDAFGNLFEGLSFGDDTDDGDKE
ncbi:bifunctional 4-hydroxy-3-methylbut-2-enyl diphosphate reductase/30S ribosomal protein S1 [Eubacterium aggregans]|uniref:bifunctional 4-hydroxy-3-methylbut-2-enyl diphosphate reductase/30S ribosomal protein S1 n=1 Tax=Eubacterium aggregans TaxID=81409 RepID=UPI0023F323C4|nr:bifunctional 4-hydroxy-3-methylbut-2-enyl diphosphate reductase/30S ribosomal protein S1 [Eubacterium aggregans]MDD4691913.1 bifunctional 4-hydroxy-3-methylbut-2-enyl diphosphate reductase/30S ribosomal protein S1 [Eubacterium aggregans]